MEDKIKIAPVNEFYTYQEYEELKKYLTWLLAEDILTSIEKGKLPVIVPFFGDEEKWYLDKKGCVWILIPPDYPFRGFFKRLSDIR